VDFDRWRARADKRESEAAPSLKRADLMRPRRRGFTNGAVFRSGVEMAGRSFALDYHHEPARRVTA